MGVKSCVKNMSTDDMLITLKMLDKFPNNPVKKSSSPSSSRSFDYYLSATPLTIGRLSGGTADRLLSDKLHCTIQRSIPKHIINCTKILSDKLHYNIQREHPKIYYKLPKKYYQILLHCTIQVVIV